jgi:hypothetical protein
LKALFIFISLTVFSLNAQATLGTHGMVLFGQEKLMAYHLPMFHKIHAYQVIFEYALPNLEKEQILTLLKNQTLLTFVPHPFDLEKFMLNPHPLKGDLYNGHFEKDGVIAISGITLENPKITYKAAITKNNGKAKETYKLVGTPIDLYLVHLLDGGTHVDQIVKININPAQENSIYNAYRVINENLTFETSGLALLNQKYQMNMLDFFSTQELFTDSVM